VFCVCFFGGPGRFSSVPRIVFGKCPTIHPFLFFHGVPPRLTVFTVPFFFCGNFISVFSWFDGTPTGPPGPMALSTFFLPPCCWLFLLVLSLSPLFPVHMPKNDLQPVTPSVLNGRYSYAPFLRGGAPLPWMKPCDPHFCPLGFTPGLPPVVACTLGSNEPDPVLPPWSERRILLFSLWGAVF